MLSIYVACSIFHLMKQQVYLSGQFRDGRREVNSQGITTLHIHLSMSLTLMVHAGLKVASSSSS